MFVVFIRILYLSLDDLLQYSCEKIESEYYAVIIMGLAYLFCFALLSSLVTLMNGSKWRPKLRAQNFIHKKIERFENWL